MQQFQYIKHLNSCKVAWHSVNNMRQKGHQDLRYSARADRAGFESKAASEPTLHRNSRLPGKKCLAQILPLKAHLRCGSAKAILFHSILLWSALLLSPLCCSTLLFSSLLYSTLLYSTLLYSTLLYSTLPDSILRQCLLSYFSASGTCQLDFMIFGANSLLFRNMPTGLDLWSYFSTSGTCQLDLMVFWAMLLVTFRNSDLLCKTSFDWYFSKTYQA